MACLKAGDLKRILDDPAAAANSHLHACPKCQRAIGRFMETERRVDHWLSALTPAEEINPDVRTALARLRSRDEMRPLPVTSGWWASPSRYVSVAVHAGFVALLMFGATTAPVQQTIRDRFELIDPNLMPYTAKPARGGGGGGAREPLPVTAGRIPTAALKQFVPPQIVNQQPKLTLEPSLVLPPDVAATQAANWGDPLAKLMNNSNGSGSSGGMGSGARGGIGPGDGSGFGPGANGAYGGDVYRSGNGVTQPVLVLKVEPEYSENARKATYSGTVLLSVIVGKDGQPRDIHVIRSLGMGLDEKAVEAVQKWRFKPGMKAGQAVNVRAQIEVNFRLL
ncbi:MAG TPA: energy transducer TonB [Bryobacteraceae bacterium]|jgi:TonB family protein|nr:energy transducer TonB [Bryobacteraceae bacterium]